jgi:hypothetical protein
MKKFRLTSWLVAIALIETTAFPVYSGEIPLGDDLTYRGCTVITISKGDSVFFGGNDDYINPDSYYWIEPGDSSKYGVIWIGTPDNPQQGINEKYLAYDANGLPRFNVNPHTERIPVPGEYHNYCMQIMHECSTIREVIDWVNKHQRFPYMHDQLHFADATGDAVIISAGKDGEMVFTRKGPGDGFLVSTNFNVANPLNGTSYPCWRYDLAQELLPRLIEKDEPLEHTDLTEVMDAVHEESASWTIETMVADLVNGLVYIYYFYQYDNPVILSVSKELSSPREPGPLSILFPEEVRKEATRRYTKNMSDQKINTVVGISWPLLVIASLILLFTVAGDFRKGLRFWLPAVLILGPFALIIRLIADKQRRTGVGNDAVIETLGDMIPVVIAYTAGIVILILKMLGGGISWQFQLTVILVMPLILVLAYHLALLAPVSKNNVGIFMAKRPVQVLASTFMALGGIIPVALPLVNKTLCMALLDPLSPLSIMTWWAFSVLGAFPGGILVFLMERWIVRRDFRAWTIFAGEDGEVVTPGWSRLWWWFVISFFVLVAGLITGAALVR